MASTIYRPGTTLGPCIEPCDHEKCHQKYDIAESLCNICNELIGYEREYDFVWRYPKYRAPVEQRSYPVHLSCLQGQEATPVEPEASASGRMVAVATPSETTFEPGQILFDNDEEHWYLVTDSRIVRDVTHYTLLNLSIEYPSLSEEYLTEDEIIDWQHGSLEKSSEVEALQAENEALREFVRRVYTQCTTIEDSTELRGTLVAESWCLIQDIESAPEISGVDEEIEALEEHYLQSLADLQAQNRELMLENSVLRNGEES